MHKFIHPVCNLVKTHTHTLTLLCDAGRVSCLCSPELVGVVSLGAAQVALVAVEVAVNQGIHFLSC